MEKVYCERQSEIGKRKGVNYINSAKQMGGDYTFHSSNKSQVNKITPKQPFTQKKEESYDCGYTPDSQEQQNNNPMLILQDIIIQQSLQERPSQSTSSQGLVKLEEQRKGITEQQNNNNESSQNQSIQSNSHIQIRRRDKQEAHKEPHPVKKIAKKKSGRPLKKNFANANRQKIMKEYGIEDECGSAYSSENYQLLITTFIIFGQDKNNSNMYIVKRAAEGDKAIDLSIKIQQFASLERKRMWLNFYKISKILTSPSKQIMESLYLVFQRFIESNMKQQQQSNEENLEFLEQNNNILMPNQFLLKQLEDIKNIKSLFDSSSLLKSLYSDKGYFLFTRQCFDPATYQLNEGTSQNKELRQFEYQEIEKTLLVANNITKKDFLCILFSCAICDYYNVQSPYYEILCNLL